MKHFSATIILLLLLPAAMLSQDSRLRKVVGETGTAAGAIVDKYHTINRIGLTVTNFSVLGNAFKVRDASGDQLPSGEFPINSETEHLYRAALWIGGLSRFDNRVHVTTGVIDATAASAGSDGFEFVPVPPKVGIDSIIVRSSLKSSQYYHPQAVSHQDFVTEYWDVHSQSRNHTPLEVLVHQESYAWNLDFANSFIIVSYDITNIGDFAIDSLYVGMYTELVTASKIWWGQTWTSGPGAEIYQHKRLGFLDSLRLIWETTDTGQDGLGASYGGFKFLGSSPQPLDSVETHFTWHGWPDMLGITDDAFFYDVMKRKERWNWWTDPNRVPQDQLPSEAQRVYGWQDVTDSYLSKTGYPDPIPVTSFGPYASLEPGEKVNLTIAFVCGENYERLLGNAFWAQKAYDSQYRLTAPPESPELVVLPADGKMTLYWNNISEGMIDTNYVKTLLPGEKDTTCANDPGCDPNTGLRDFEGYRVYRGEPDRVTGEVKTWSLIAQFDKKPGEGWPIEYGGVDNSKGHNTGMPTKETDPSSRFVGYYKYVNEGVKNGFSYAYAVTAYDVGDDQLGLPSFESGVEGNATVSIPGSEPQSSLKNVTVYPNPYKASSLWDTGDERGRRIYFAGLPEDCVIRVYTLGLDLVKTIEHQSVTTGLASWNLVTDPDQAVATGLYIYVVTDRRTGETYTGKFLVIK